MKNINQNSKIIKSTLLFCPYHIKNEQIWQLCFFSTCILPSLTPALHRSTFQSPSRSCFLSYLRTEAECFSSDVKDGDLTITLCENPFKTRPKFFMRSFKRGHPAQKFLNTVSAFKTVPSKWCNFQKKHLSVQCEPNQYEKSYCHY